MTKGGRTFCWICTGFSGVFAVIIFPLAVQKWGFIIGFGATLLGVVVIWAGGLLRGMLFGLKWQDLTEKTGQPENKPADYDNK